MFCLVSEFSLDYFSGVRKSYDFDLNKEKDFYRVSSAEMFRNVQVKPRKLPLIDTILQVLIICQE